MPGAGVGACARWTSRAVATKPFRLIEAVRTSAACDRWTAVSIFPPALEFRIAAVNHPGHCSPQGAPAVQCVSALEAVCAEGRSPQLSEPTRWKRCRPSPMPRRARKILFGHVISWWVSWPAVHSLSGFSWPSATHARRPKPMRRAATANRPLPRSWPPAPTRHMRTCAEVNANPSEGWTADNLGMLRLDQIRFASWPLRRAVALRRGWDDQPPMQEASSIGLRRCEHAAS